MSRWTKRTQEEKDAISKKLEGEQTSKEERKNKHDYMSSYQNKILEEGDIPLFCTKCGWSYSDNYILEEGISVFGTKEFVVIGSCKECGIKIAREIPLTLEMLMIYPLLFATLQRQGRLVDRRSTK